MYLGTTIVKVKKIRTSLFNRKEVVLVWKGKEYVLRENDSLKMNLYATHMNVIFDEPAKGSDAS